MRSWSLQFIKRYGAIVTLPSLARWWLFSVQQGRGSRRYTKTIKLRLRAPYSCRMMMRPVSNDLYTFNEMFVDRVYRQVTTHLKAPEYVIDAGANIGLATVFLNGSFKHIKRVVCVEPDPANVQLLRYNLGGLVSQGIASIYHGALWGEESMVRLNSLEQGHVNQRACVSADTLLYGDDDAIPAYTVDSLIRRENLPSVDLLKMDIEGGECSVFAGDTGWLDMVRVLAVEFHGESRQQIGFDELMRKYGFTIVGGGSAHTVIAVRP